MKTHLAKIDIVARATSKFGMKGYSIRTNGDNSVVFEDGKELNWILFLVLLFFTAVIGVIIYWMVSRRKQIIIIFMPFEGHVDVSGRG